MQITAYDKIYLEKGHKLKTKGGSYFPDDVRTKYCRNPKITDWTQPCPLCGRRVRVQRWLTL